MLKIHTIGTGSSGNCYIIQYNETDCFILEAGIPLSAIESFFKTIPLTPKFLLISHEHGDHLGNANSISKRFSIKVLLHKDIKEITHKISLYNIIPLVNKQTYKIGNICYLKTFLVSHDVPNLGYQIEFINGERETFAFFTDLGTTKTLPTKFYTSTDWKEINLDVLMIETNYSDNVLLSNIVDEITKVKNLRVKSDFGHLSNKDCFDYLKNLPLSFTDVLLIHPSSSNLDPMIDYEIFKYLPAKSVQPISLEEGFICLK